MRVNVLIGGLVVQVDAVASENVSYADVDANMRAAPIYVEEFVSFLLLICRAVFLCRPITISGCRALQA